jgi:hypothetical protein
VLRRTPPGLRRTPPDAYAGRRGDGSNSRVLLYGAYGYTGRLAAELAAAKKLDVVLAGRNKDALTGLGNRLNLPTRVVGLDDVYQLSEALKRHCVCCAHGGSVRGYIRSDAECMPGYADELRRYHR